MSAPTQYGYDPQQTPGTIHLVDILRGVWAERPVLLVGTIVGLLLGLLYLHVATYYYTATLTVVPTQSQSKGLSGGLGDLASLAGIDLSGTQNVSPFTLYPEALKSRVVADEMAKQYPDIMHNIFKDQWDEASRRWVQHVGPFGFVRRFVGAIIGIPPSTWTAPSGAQLQQYIVDRVAVRLDTRKPILTITFNHPDPVFAARFLQALNSSTDQSLRRMTLERSSSYAAYLESKLATEQLSELRQVLMNSLGQQETLIMMSSSRNPFAAQPLSPPTSSLRPTYPAPIVVLILGIVLGCGLGVALIVLGLATGDDVRLIFHRYSSRLGRRRSRAPADSWTGD